MSELNEQELTRIMAERNLDRKGAVQYYRRQQKKLAAAAQTGPSHAAPVQTTTTADQAQANTAAVDDQHDQHAVDRFHDEGGPCPERPRQTAPVTVIDEKQNLTPAEQEKVAVLPDTPPADQPPAADTAKKRKSKQPNFDSARAVALYQGGMKVIDIAVELGYPRGSGNNRVRTALEKAGVYKKANTGALEPPADQPPAEAEKK